MLILIGAGLLAAAFTFTINWLGLIPWRRARDRHWAERARLFYPVLVAARANLWMLPAILTMSALLLWPRESPHWMLMILATGIGAVAGTIPMDHEVFPRIQWGELLRLVAVGWLIRFAMWFVFLSAIALSPVTFNLQSLVIAASVALLLAIWNYKGWIWTGRKLGLMVPPPERLQNIVRDTAAEMNVPVREIWVLWSSGSQAYALPNARTLLFTNRTLELLTDAEIASVCAHELAHLTEARAQYYKRYIQWLMFLPWLFFKPVVHACGVLGYVILVTVTTLVPRIYRDISRKLEVRADKAATAAEQDPGTYARALARLYEDNLMPAVTVRQGTHPHLYDRLMAAGVTPDFPRPEPAKATTWYGHALAVLLALLAMALVIGYVNP
jgi:Zn-dependent protease with chaperone function